MDVKQKLITQQADLLLTVLNRQRHDWLNHFQVLLGYLKLGRPEAGEEYLKRVTEEAHRESVIARINCPLLSVFFLTFNALHDEISLEVEVFNEVDLSLLSMERRDFFEFVTDFVFTLKSHLERDCMEQASLLVSLIANGKVIQIKFDLAGALHASAGPEVEKLVERSKQSGATVTEWIHTEDEWVMEFSFPCRA
jgi:stage 0 sporulation protein B (sporulation initiation phosphotransferase)